MPLPDHIVIRRTGRDDWAAFRDLRLRMLADTPLAFLETLAHARQLDEDEWRRRAGSGADDDTPCFVAEDVTTGAWAGIMGGRLDGGHPLLVSVFVDPHHRGRESGVTDALLDAVEDWARGHGDRFLLDVHEENPRAIAFYRRRGFVPTGRRVPYPLPPHGEELELVKSLR
ncbi:GNAT family N-acetyltransferase [Curtobacterium sp. MCSS17_015]|uniref:GNAT family N-acetyltransferase n=1 Tax=Curtobacterium sp. MCSS17_015 TaxID=2175666 RepID=UPI0021AC7F5C|nr:GNAT family N-acetyltransferase [Curtobacterium sp. MCSS17_015]WIB25994.1 GNAT family N-acetyltransferase [Curtobacterium sp. MCSS17_015]